MSERIVIRSHRRLMGMIGRIVRPEEGLVYGLGIDHAVDDGEAGMVVNARWQIGPGGAPEAILTVSHRRAMAEYHVGEVEFVA
ncbi:hypothetical protein [Tepidimonas ignava]|uniref:hypothetical protein n=1 Tax=Tepidimonas ignava TaxID=114249 RepID=UPI002FDA337C